MGVVSQILGTAEENKSNAVMSRAIAIRMCPMLIGNMALPTERKSTKGHNQY